MKQMDIKTLQLTKKQAELMELLQIKNLQDLFHYYPYRYNVFVPTPLVEGSKVVIGGTITSPIKSVFFQGRKNRINFEIMSDNQLIKVVIFNRYFMFNALKQAKDVSISGVYTKKTNTIVVNDIKLMSMDKAAGIYPLYHLKNNYKNNDYAKLVFTLLKKYYQSLDNVLPDFLIKKYQLLQKKDAIRYIHFPTDEKILKYARRSLIYEELFLYAVNNILVKNQLTNNDAYIKDFNFDDLQVVFDQLEFKLTNDQQQVLQAISEDLSSNKLMNRLILADVGSGKTIVALLSAYLTYLSGYQTALMAPTTILATQHYQTARALFDKIEFNVALLTSSTSAEERRAILADLSKGKTDLIIGTHALIQDDVQFKNLGLAILDEQQRFGVNQRKQLKDKGDVVESLMLSATPIPRTLAQTYYSALDVSYIYEKPSFKKPIISYYYQSKSIKPFYDKLMELLEQRNQVYIVTPLVMESENIDTKNAIAIYENIKKYFDGQYKVGLAHGKMKNDEKNKVMEDFVNHDINILVATSLIEVGVNVKNANCIVIYDAHRFGLSQLHQLRGRVGRGSRQGYCVFLSNADDEKAIAKLEFLASTNDGFKIAEYDLEHRGPGDILGLKQSGLPSFNIANLVSDKKIFDLAQIDAQDFFAQEEAFQKWYQQNRDIINNKTLYSE